MTVDVAALKQRIGLRICEKREAAKLSQEELAYLARLSPTYLCQIEKGQRNPSVGLLCRIVNVLEIEFDDLTRD